jgi:hypothetical protein
MIVREGGLEPMTKSKEEIRFVKYNEMNHSQLLETIQSPVGK